MAEEKAAAPEAAAPAPASSNKPPILLLVLLIVNMAAIGGVGFMLYKNKQAQHAQPGMPEAEAGEKATQEEEANQQKEFVGKVVPLETFIVNLSGTKGRRVAKVNLELEIQGLEKEGGYSGIQDELEKRKAQIRDIIIILLSGKSYDEVATREGKEQLRNEIKDTVNAFLTNGKIANVYFTDFIYN